MQGISSPVQKLPASHQELRSTGSAALMPFGPQKGSWFTWFWYRFISHHHLLITLNDVRPSSPPLAPNKLCRSTTQNKHNSNPFSYFLLAQKNWRLKRNQRDPPDISGFVIKCFPLMTQEVQSQLASRTSTDNTNWLANSANNWPLMQTALLTDLENGFLA